MAGIVPTQNNDIDDNQMEMEEKALLICGICQQLIDNPKCLPCLHSFCCKCIMTQKDDANNAGNTDVMQCPTCRQITKLPPGGVTSLQTNIIVAKMKEEKLDRDKLQTKHAQIQCTNCRRTLRTAVARCVACDDFMCERCLESHNSIRALKQHLVITIDEFRLGKVPQRSGLPQRDFCSTHKSEVLKFYCETCGVAMCRDCTVIEHPRPEHRHVDIEEALRQQNDVIQALTAQSVQLDQSIESNLQQSNTISDDVTIAISNAKAVLDSSVENIKVKFLQSLEQNRSQLEATLTELERDRNTLIHQDIRELESVKSRMDVALNMSTQIQKVQLSLDSDTAGAYAMVASALRNVCSERLAKTDNRFASIEFIPSKQTTIVLQEVGRIRDDLKETSAEIETGPSLANSSVTTSNEIGPPRLSSTRNDMQVFTNPKIMINQSPFRDEESLSKGSTGSGLSDGEKVSHFDSDTNVDARGMTRSVVRPAGVIDESQANSSIHTPRTRSRTSESSGEESETSYADTHSSQSGDKLREQSATRYGRMLNLGRKYGSMSNLEPRYSSMSNLDTIHDGVTNPTPQFGKMAKLAPQYRSMTSLAPRDDGRNNLPTRYGNMTNLPKTRKKYKSMTYLAHKYGSMTNLAQKYGGSMNNLATGYDSMVNSDKRYDSMTNLATLSSMSMEDLNASSLRSQTSDWILERSFGHKSNGETSFAWGVVINNDNDIVVTNQNSLGMSVFGRNGQYKRSIATRSRNRDVLIIGNEYFVTSRTKFVRVYDTNGKFQRQFHAVAPASSARLLYTVFCMTQDKATGLLVLGAGYSRSACLSIHRTDGRHVNSLKIAIEPTFIAVTSESNFIVSSHPDKLVQIIDSSSGLAQATINSPCEISQWFPSGLCCSQFDDIYIANKATDRSRGIYKFSVSGELLGCITTVVASPYGLTLTDDDHRMIVADYQSVKVFKLKCH